LLIGREFLGHRAEFVNAFKSPPHKTFRLGQALGQATKPQITHNSAIVRHLRLIELPKLVQCFR